MITLAIAASLALAWPQTETPVSIRSEPAPLHGTLLEPFGAARAVAVILPGSGPTDRNGNTAAAGLVAQPYALLAEALAAQGIATIRVDKRGVGESAAAAPSEADLRFDDLARDARAWAEEAGARTNQPCAWLIGHSEGATVGLAAVRQATDKVCGVVLIAGPGRRAGIVLREQLQRQLPEPMMAQVDTALTELEAGRATASIPGLESLLRPSVQPYLISWLAMDPQALAAAYQGPMLVMQGTTDLQVTMSDAEALHAAQPASNLVRLEGVNHVLKSAPADRAANVATYRDPALPLAPGVAEEVGKFILQDR
ncbi:MULTISPECIES: alpha/beta hydrolase [unclassified Brevundimonas]|uniref:alpha/beta hydrolase n=1 Tax=unclassified Brevundimonas TaxID=2622653 RepID=UPI0025C5FA53|nr:MULTISPECIES: alpha/beta hydrolase [unclassified Brevundimonas]